MVQEVKVHVFNLDPNTSVCKCGQPATHPIHVVTDRDVTQVKGIARPTKIG